MIHALQCTQRDDIEVQGQGRRAVGQPAQVSADRLPPKPYRMLTLRMKLALVLILALAACTITASSALPGTHRT